MEAANFLQNALLELLSATCIGDYSLPLALNCRQIRLNIKKFRLTVLEVGKKDGVYAGLKGK